LSFVGAKLKVDTNIASTTSVQCEWLELVKMQPEGLMHELISS
jgi:hypothetical protein